MELTKQLVLLPRITQLVCLEAEIYHQHHIGRLFEPVG